jgi:putative endonuclease
MIRAMACFVYILGSGGKGGVRTYVGWTTDLEKRLSVHNSGEGAKSTRGRQWRLLYAERYKNRGDAMSREWHLNRDRRFRKALAGDFCF